MNFEVVSASPAGPRGGGSPSISADGRYVAFVSYAGDLAPGDANEGPDGFLRDRVTGETRLVAPGAYRMDMSGDGRFAGYVLSKDVYGGQPNIPYSALGRADLRTGESTSGSPGSPIAVVGLSLSADGDVEAVASYVLDFRYPPPNIWIIDSGSPPAYTAAAAFPFLEGASVTPDAVSSDGRFIALEQVRFPSPFGFFDPRPPSGVQVLDRLTGTVRTASVRGDGMAADGQSYGAAISTDARFVAFTSLAANLVAGDANGVSDIFLKDFSTGALTLVSTAADGTPANGASSDATVSDGGRFVAFTSAAMNLVPGDGNGMDDLFLKDLATGAIERVWENGANLTLTPDGRAMTFESEGRVYFASRDDILVGDAGPNELIGGAGHDRLQGEDAGDILVGGLGRDELHGGRGEDYLAGGAGGDILVGGQGGDELRGGEGDDYLAGEAEGDVLVGESGADELRGGEGRDYLVGRDGNDVLVGEQEGDFLIGGAGADYLVGGAGADEFIFFAASDSNGAGLDLIADLETGIDKLNLWALHTGGPDRLSVENFGGYAIVAVDQGGDGSFEFAVQVNPNIALGDILF